MKRMLSKCSFLLTDLLVRVSTMQETPENAADVPHLDYLHGPSLLNGTDLRNTRTLSTVCYKTMDLFRECVVSLIEGVMPFVRHRWEADWKPMEEEGQTHISVLTLTHHAEVFGYKLPFLTMDVQAKQVCLEFVGWMQ
jgi:cholesterol 7-desaturase